MAANRTAHRTVVTSPRPGAGSSTATASVLVDNRAVARGHRRLRSSSDKLSQPEQQARLLDRLAAALSRSAPDQAADRRRELRRRIDDLRFSRFRPVPVARTCRRSWRSTWPSVPTSSPPSRPHRGSRSGPIRTARSPSHVLGYVGHRERRRVEEAAGEATTRVKPYSQNDEIGKAGARGDVREPAAGDAGAASATRSTPGTQPIREIGQRTEPKPGNDVYLTHRPQGAGLDRGGAAGRSAAGPAHEHQDGAPPARQAGSSVDRSTRATARCWPWRRTRPTTRASSPTASARRRVPGAHRPGQRVPADQPGDPGRVRAGSTFKLATAYAGLKLGMIHPDDRITDPGYYDVPELRRSRGCRKFNAGQSAHGSVDLHEALTVSSDVYFYGSGSDIWAARESAGRPEGAAGRGARTSGSTPRPASTCRASCRAASPPRAGCGSSIEADPQRTRHVERGRWRAGDNMNVAIGQGDRPGHAAAARQRLRHLRQRRHAVPP